MRKILFGFSTICLIILLVGCLQSNNRSSPETIEYSNLLNDSVQEDLSVIMSSAGISDERQEIFFDHVKQFNSTVSTEGLVGEFAQKDISEVPYDPYAMQDEWNTAHPYFLGYNCRITAFSLLGDYIEIPTDTESRMDMIMQDMASLEEDSSVLINEGDYDRFLAFYSTVPTESTQETSVHVKNLQSDWEKRGIIFDEQSKARLISVIFHDSWDDADYLFIGHIGVLFPVSEDELYFVEKITFQEPYQLTRFKNRVELNDYLMAKYDVSYGQPTAAPFIMENDKLMEEYRQNPDKS